MQETTATTTTAAAAAAAAAATPTAAYVHSEPTDRNSDEAVRHASFLSGTYSSVIVSELVYNS